MRKKNVVIIILCIMVCLMVVAYSSFATLLQISGTANIDSVWDIYFESITTKQIVGYASNTTNPYVNNLSATINFEMKAPGDKLVYEVIIKNNGTLDAGISEIEVEKGGVPQITYEITGLKKGDKVSANSTKTITITIEYDLDVTSTPSLDETYLVINIVSVQYTGSIPSEDIEIYEPMLMKATDTSGSTQPFLEGPMKKEQIETVTFTNSKTVPTGVIGSWDVSAGDDGTVMAWYYDTDGDNLYEVYIGQDGGVIANPISRRLFYYCTKLTNIDLTYLDTSKATDMQAMFSHTNITTLDLSRFNTSKVTTMRNIFYDCPSLIELDLSSFNTSNVTNMEQMFSDCRSLTKLNLSSFNTSNVTLMSGMFYRCTSLTELDLSRFNTANVTSMNEMFFECKSLTSLDLSSFDTSKVTNMYDVFGYCQGLEILDLSSFNTANVTEMKYLFINATKLKTVYVSDKWNTSNVTSSSAMFTNCNAIVGGNGTTYNSSYVDKTYARVDTASTPGYFTYKGN